MKTFLFFTLMVISFSIKAFQVEPFIQLMEPIGKKSNATFKITNTTDKPLPIETELLKSSLNSDDIESTIESEDFFIMPPQTLIPANSSQVFRVRYLGGSEINKSEPYRVLFKQLSLDQSEKKGSHVEVLFNFSALILLSPMNAKEELAINVSSLNNTYSINIENEGNKFSDLSKKQLEIQGSKDDVILNWQDFSDLTQFQFVLPGRSKSFTITSEMFPAIGQIKSIDFIPM